MPDRIPRGYIIAKGKEKDFFEKMNANRPTKEYWEKCAQMRKKMNTKEFIDEMDATIERRKKINEYR